MLSLACQWKPDLIVREPAEFAWWAIAESRAIPHVTVNAGAANSAAEWEACAGPWLREGRHIGLDDLRASSLYR
jgi:hypothetical protein